MYTSQIVLLSGKGIITNAIVDLLPSNFDVTRLYFSDDDIQHIIKLEAQSLSSADVIILNLSEMNVDGERAIKSLTQSYTNTPIIVLHLYQQQIFIDAFLKMGANAYLPVNFTSEELRLVIEKVLKKKSSHIARV